MALIYRHVTEPCPEHGEHIRRIDLLTEVAEDEVPDDEFLESQDVAQGFMEFYVAYLVEQTVLHTN